MNPWVQALGEERLARAEQVFQSSTSPLVEQVRDAVGADTHFGLWLLQVDSILRARTGLTLFHMDGSWPWRESYAADDHPGIAAQKALRDHPKWGFMDVGELEEPPTLPTEEP